MTRIAAVVVVWSLMSCASKTSSKESDQRASASTDADPPRSSKPGPSAPKKGVLLNDAKNTIAMLTRSAMAAYERESMVETKPGEELAAPHQLCKSAKPLGAKVPVGGESFDLTEQEFEGAEDTGWKCLRFSPAKSVSFQYTYTLGSTPKHAARGSDIGKGDPNVFEICAEADLVPGGKTTLLCQSGTVITESKQVRVAAKLFIADEGE